MRCIKGCMAAIMWPVAIVYGLIEMLLLVIWAIVRGLLE